MTRYITRLCAGALGLTCGVLAQAAPVVIDSEQSAASSVVAATSVIHVTPHYHSLLSQQIVQYATIALNSVNSATTPAALMASPAGVTVPCGTSGTLQARMAARQPRVLKFEWHDCHFSYFGWPTSLDGPGEIVLLSDSFTPLHVGSIRFGNTSTDLIQTRQIVTPDQTNNDVFKRNLRMVGAIPLTNFQGAGNTVEFAYVITGFIDERYNVTSPDRDPETYGYLYKMEALTYVGSVGYDETFTVVDEDLRVLFGEFSWEVVHPAPWAFGIEKFKYNNLRVHNVTDYGVNWDRTTTLDGKVDYQWYTQREPGCLSGGYSFKTFAPIHRSLNNFERFDAGDIGINNKMRSSYFSESNVPPGLPVPVNGMLIHNVVTGVGTFDYDVDTARVGSWDASGCRG